MHRSYSQGRRFYPPGGSPMEFLVDCNIGKCSHLCLGGDARQRQRQYPKQKQQCGGRMSYFGLPGSGSHADSVVGRSLLLASHHYLGYPDEDHYVICVDVPFCHLECQERYGSLEERKIGINRNSFFSRRVFVHHVKVSSSVKPQPYPVD